MMPSDTKSTTPASSFYEEYLAELDEIRRYKWIESQKANEDIGFERALTEWVGKYRDTWRQERRTRPGIDSVTAGKPSSSNKKMAEKINQA